MRLVKWGSLALATAVGLAGSSTALANPPSLLERSGNTFHYAVCGHFAAMGTARCFAHVITDARGNIFNGKTNLTRNAVPSGYGPSDLRSAYGITDAITAPTSSSPTIAIVDANGYANAEADLAVYRSQYGLPACTTANGCFRKVDQSGGTHYPREDTGWAQETALDLDMASAMCPSCKILLVEGSSATFSDLATAENTAARLGAVAISNSYGGGESGSNSYESAYNHPGIAITVSTGDSGYGAQFPATSPHVVAVGGTHLTRDSSSRGWNETVWTSAGSGCSTVYGAPTFQSGANTGCGNRAEADVSAVADPNTGVAVYGPSSRTRSGWMVFGGTSVSAPLVGGIYALSGVASGSYPASTLYSGSASLWEVTSGSNGSCGTQICNARAGWDGPTGMGTPKGKTSF